MRKRRKHKVKEVTVAKGRHSVPMARKSHRSGGNVVAIVDVQTYTVRVKDELDASGNVVPSNGPFTFTLSDGSLGTLTLNADGLGVDFTSSGIAGAGTITVLDTSDNLTAVSNFEVTLGPGSNPAVTLEITESVPA